MTLSKSKKAKSQRFFLADGPLAFKNRSPKDVALKARAKSHELEDKKQNIVRHVVRFYSLGDVLWKKEYPWPSCTDY